MFDPEEGANRDENNMYFCVEIAPIKESIDSLFLTQYHIHLRRTIKIIGTHKDKCTRTVGLRRLIGAISRDDNPVRPETGAPRHGTSREMPREAKPFNRRCRLNSVFFHFASAH